MRTIDKTEVRKQIQNKLDSEYLKLIISIENAAKEIWAPNNRIIPYYTDHGVDHSYRIIYYLFKMIENKRLALSMEEYFILLGAAFLHDIGMQCDLNKHTDFKRLLYEKEVTSLSFSNRFSEYTTDEINELRRIHNKVSYWWIIEASKNKTKITKFNTSIQDIKNPLLVQDIADICLFHTKKDIYKAEKFFKYDPENRRKSEITALFRLADELDIDARRVENLINLDNFSYNEFSEFVWWLHSRIRITFDSFGNIVQIVSLNNEDTLHKEIILKKLEKDLNDKNKRLINLMRNNDFIDIRIMQPECVFSEAEKMIPEKYVMELQRFEALSPSPRNKTIIPTKTIISSIFHNNRQLKKELFNGTMLYELWEGNSGLPHYYLILGKHKLDDEKWDMIATSIKSSEIEYEINIKSITIISLHATKNFIESRVKLDIDYVVYTLKNFVWEFIIDRGLKDINLIINTDHYTEQTLFEVNTYDDRPFPLSTAYKYLYGTYIQEEKKHRTAEKYLPIFIQAHGGTGKSYLLNKLTTIINEAATKKEKLAFLISSENFIQNIRKINKNEKIDSIQKLIKVYAEVIHGLTLSEIMISQAFYAGNLVILIDGIDEYISIYGDNFLQEDFFQSVTDFYADDLSNAKIIITSRLSPRMEGAVKDISMRRCFIKGFDNQALKSYIEVRLDGETSNSENLLEQIVEFFPKETYYSPFFIKTIIDSYQEDGKDFELKSSSAKAKDDLVRFILEREIRRQDYKIDIEKAFNIFYQIALFMKNNEESYVNNEDLLLIVNDNRELLNKLLINPLLGSKPSGDGIFFKFPFLRSYFSAKYFISCLDKYAINIKFQIEDDFKNGFSEFEVGIGEAFQQVVEHYKDNINTNTDIAVKNILEFLRQNKINNERDSELISSLMHLLFQVYEDKYTTQKEKTSLLKKVFNNEDNYNKIYNLCLYGNLPALNFSNLQIVNADFSAYSAFAHSTFNSGTKFEDSAFDIIGENLEKNKNLTNCIFDDMCTRNEVLLDICKENEVEAYVYISDLLEVFYDIISRFIKNKLFVSCRIHTSNIGDKGSRKILDFLLKENVIVRDTHKKDNYKISNFYEEDILRVNKEGGGYSIKLIRLIKDYNSLTNSVNDKDIEYYMNNSTKVQKLIRNFRSHAVQHGNV